MCVCYVRYVNHSERNMVVFLSIDLPELMALLYADFSFQSPLFEGGISLLWRMTHLAFSSFSSLTVCQLAALFKASIFIGKVNAVCPKILKFLHRYGVQRGNAIM